NTLTTCFVTSPKSTCNWVNPGPRTLANSSRGVRSACHTPETSGLPLTRGAGAERFGLPSAVRGVLGSRWSSHCASTHTILPISTSQSMDASLEIFLSPPLRSTNLPAAPHDSEQGGGGTYVFLIFSRYSG